MSRPHRDIVAIERDTRCTPSDRLWFAGGIAVAATAIRRVRPRTTTPTLDSETAGKPCCPLILMKKNRDKRFSLASETLRTLASVELTHVIGGLGVVTGRGAYQSCTCDTSDECHTQQQ